MITCSMSMQEQRHRSYELKLDVEILTRVQSINVNIKEQSSIITVGIQQNYRRAGSMTTACYETLTSSYPKSTRQHLTKF